MKGKNFLLILVFLQSLLIIFPVLPKEKGEIRMNEMSKAHWDVHAPNGWEANIVSKKKKEGSFSERWQQSEFSTNEKNTLIFKTGTYLSEKEKQALFVWLRRIPSVAYVVQYDDAVCVDFKKGILSKDGSLELSALFYRFKISMHQLNDFLDSIEKDWEFKEDGKPNHYNVWPRIEKPEFLGKGDTLICGKIWYYSLIDECIFFEWLERIPSVDTSEGVREQLFIDIKSDSVPDEDLKELIALFYRYRIRDMTQLKVFLNKRNKEWFFDNQYAYWHEHVFGEPRTKLICNDATFNDDAESEEEFEKWIKRIPSVDELDDFGEKLHVYVKSTVISDADLEDLILLFHRFKIKNMGQLKVFLNDQNKEWFFDDKEAYWHEHVFGKSK